MTDATMMTPQIAVIIPCYNHADVLRRTLEALAAQTLLPSEVVVVEDGSAEPSKNVVEAFRLSHATFPIEYVAFETNRGAPAARNEGARRTIAPFLLFLDADAELVPSGLQQLSETLQAHPEAAFAYANMYWGKVAMPAKTFDLKELQRRNYIHTSSLIRREAFPGFDESIKKFQDWDLWLTIAERGRVGIWIDQFLFHIDTRPHVGAMSKWLPSFMHKLPWPILGWMPKEIKKYRMAEKIIREKHGIAYPFFQVDEKSIKEDLPLKGGAEGVRDLRIVIVSWNVEKLLGECLTSLKEACGSLDWECVVVDNASRDESVALARRFASEESRVSVIANQANLGFGKACNQGTKGSGARYVLYLNPDAHCPVGSLERLVKVADERPRAAILGPKLVYPDGRYQESIRRFPDVWSMAGIFLKLHRIFTFLPVFKSYLAQDHDTEREQSVDQVMGACFLVRREFIAATGGFDERYFIWFEEVDWCKTAATSGWEVLYVPSVTVVHAQGEAFGQVFSLKRQRYLVRSAIQYFEKWHPAWQAKLLKSLVPLSLFEAWVVGVLQLPGAIWLLGLLIVELLSALTLFHSKVTSLVTLFVTLLVFVFAWKRPVWALGVLLLELLVGSKGQLLQFGIWPVTVSGRIFFTAAFLLGWSLSMLKKERIEHVVRLMRSHWQYFVLFAMIALGFLRGYLMHNGHTIIGDGNAWLDWVLLFPILEVAQRYSASIRRSLAPVFVVGILWLALKTLGLEYLFSHGFKLSSDAYLWVRRTGVGEVTLVVANAFRIFMQSYVYAGAAWLLAVAWYVAGPTTLAPRPTSPPAPSPSLGEGVLSDDILEPSPSEGEGRVRWIPGGGSRFQSRLAWCVLLASTFLLGISLSRSIWIGVFAGALVLVGLLLKTKSMQWKRLFGPISASLCGVLLIFATLAFPWPATNAASLASLFGSRTNMSEAAAVSRWSLIPVLMKKIGEHPILGSGFGATVTYRSYDPRILATNPTGADTTYAFEWGWLEHWIKFGIVGIPVILWLLISLTWRLWKSDEALWLRVGAVSSLVALGVIHFFTPYLNHPLGFLFFFVGEVILVTSVKAFDTKPNSLIHQGHN